MLQLGQSPWGSPRGWEGGRGVSVTPILGPGQMEATQLPRARSPHPGPQEEPAPTPALQDLRCVLGLWTLLALPGALGSGRSAEDSPGSSSSVTVVLLLLLLLLLATGLALAWCRLSRDSGGYYHPARLGAALWGRTHRLLWASPPGRWLRAELGSPEEDPERQEDERDVEDDCDLGGGQEERESQEEGQRGEGPSPQQAPEPAEEAYDDDTEGGLGLGSQGPVGSGGSAEALLSELHAFAGSAAWDDSTRAAGSRGLHVTAL
ncbi:protein tyrosine phosphatase receptor type C-associated protein isoform X1 [Tursiops truncatus]|uniref:Protein tyrosine phosphatase receptor type C-associated protein isoform X1 n=1 Tax=Tursiops truncatus TaxID=9739 RepID=A0A6J3RR36_TURTR|nr:protein tyrosine phosphatase receptor type C-associated protein isoform X1 [Tursiops truncatus]